MATSDIHEWVDNARVPGDDENEPQGGTMTLIEHLEELRRRIIVCLIGVAVASIAAFIFWDPILAFLASPLPKISSPLLKNGHLIVNDPGGGFIIAFKIALAVGLAVSMPLLLYEVWAYIAPALTRRELKYAKPFTVLGAGLFVVGVSTGFLVLRYPLEFLIEFGSDRFTYLISADSYFGFVSFFMLAFGIVFELPLVLVFLSLLGVVSSRFLREKRKYILFGLWFLSVFITPGADPYSPVIVGISFTVLYELSIILIRAIGK
jgi:sec-independent protein translocase protein TatC